MNSYYILTSPISVRLPAHPDADPEFIAELMTHIAPGNSFSVTCDAPNDMLLIGDADPIALPAKREFAIEVTEHGVAIVGGGFASLMRGFVTLLEKIELDRTTRTYRIPALTDAQSPFVGIRMVHFCVFPETTLSFLQKCIRSAALVKYTHVILEFWGTLKYSCLRELSWSSGFTKEQIRPLVREARSLGVEIVPMFNHLGHAASCRSIHGKHVVLDQNPTLEYLFTSRGWVWDFTAPEVRALMRSIRAELMELCGDGSYFHLGCDEAYEVGLDPTRISSLVEYLNEIQGELLQVGRRAIIWGDMLLCNDTLPHEKGVIYSANSTEEIARYFCTHLDHTIVIADWQYELHERNLWPTTAQFVEQGFDVLACPWESPANIRSGISCASSAGVMGLMETTWHHLAGMFPWMLYAGRVAWSGNENELSFHEMYDYAAQMTRRARPASGVYEDAGWSAKSVGPGL